MRSAFVVAWLVASCAWQAFASASPQADAGLRPTPTPDPGPPSDYQPGQYPPNYDWGEHYPYTTNPYKGSPYRGRHN